jgi:hypothetical protein
MATIWTRSSGQLPAGLLGGSDRTYVYTYTYDQSSATMDQYVIVRLSSDTHVASIGNGTDGSMVELNYTNLNNKFYEFVYHPHEVNGNYRYDLVLVGLPAVAFNDDDINQTLPGASVIKNSFINAYSPAGDIHLNYYANANGDGTYSPIGVTTSILLQD